MTSDGIALRAAEFERSSWKTALNWTAALLTAFLFLVAGIYKIADPVGMAVKLAQLKVPEALSLPSAVLLGTVETFAGVLLLVPRYRRWGAWLATGLLVVFMLYVGFFYNELRGMDCSCFPWVKRAVGPAFFVGDAIMLVFAALAGMWNRRAENLRGAVLVLAAVCVFSAVSFGVAVNQDSGTAAPASIQVEGKAVALGQGKVFLYFFDPACLHCLAAGKKMAAMDWGETRFIGVPSTDPQFAGYFMEKTGLKRPFSTDYALLKKTFGVKGTPGGVALENGREKAELTRFEGDEPAATLKRLGQVR